MVACVADYQKKSTTSADIQKRAIKKLKTTRHSCRIVCERCKSAREWRIALYKSNHHLLLNYYCLSVVVVVVVVAVVVIVVVLSNFVLQNMRI